MKTLSRLSLLFILLTGTCAATERPWGVEINPYLLVGSVVDSEMNWFSGGISRFIPGHALELRLPVFYQSRGRDRDLIAGFSLRRYFPSRGRGLFPSREEMKVESWIKRTAEVLTGLIVPGYQAPGMRPFVGVTTRLYHSRDTVTDATRLGIGGTLGVRWFSSRRLYWGADVTLGRYLLGDTDASAAVDRFILPPYDGGKIMADFTFFQFGYRF